MQLFQGFGGFSLLQVVDGVVFRDLEDERIAGQAGCLQCYAQPLQKSRVDHCLCGDVQE